MTAVSQANMAQGLSHKALAHLWSWGVEGFSLVGWPSAWGILEDVSAAETQNGAGGFGGSPQRAQACHAAGWCWVGSGLGQQLLCWGANSWHYQAHMCPTLYVLSRIRSRRD